MSKTYFSYYSKFVNTNNLINEINDNVLFHRDNIEISSNEEKVIIQERRGTSWLSNNKELTFEYSGKVMKPNPIPVCIENIRLKLLENFNIDFDGILVNYYYDKNSAMGYHSDPIENKWSNNFIVISIGETREFVFREKNNKENKIRYNFGDGDLIYMYNTCQEFYEHSLRKGKNDNIRISLVFKKSE